ncbi:MAG: S9 family peptidase [Hyphomicrobiales bacterium]
MPSRAVTPEDLLDFRFVDAVVPSPDGTRAVYEIRTIDAERDAYDVHLWLIDGKGGAPRRLTFGPHKNTGAVFSPDGRAIAFVSNRHEKKPQIHRLPLDGGEAERLTDLDGDVGGLDWSPDGAAIAFTYQPSDPPEAGHLPGSTAERKAVEAKREKKEHPPEPTFRHVTRILYKMDGMGWLPKARTHVHVLDLASRAVRALTSGDFDHGAPRWSPDGRSIAFTANRQDDEEFSSYAVSDVFVVPAAGGAPRNLTPQPGIAASPSWSPDGSTIAFVGHDRPDDWWGVPNFHVWVVPAAGGPARDLLPGFDRYAADLTGSDLRDFHASGAPVFTRDGKAIVFQVSEEGSTHLWSVPVAGGAPKRLLDGPMQVLTMARGRDQEDLFVIRCGHTDAGTIARVDPGRGTVTPLVTPNAERFAALALVEPEEFWIDAPQGHRVQAWLVAPPDAGRAKRHPMVLQIHGGPRVQYGACLYHEFQVLASAGFYVLFINPRGSQGYGETFTSAIVHDWAAPAFEDLMLAVDAALARHPEIDPDRLGVTGGSYGGYMTNWVVTHTDRFRAAVTQRCVTTIPTLLLGDDLMPLATPEFGAEPWQDAEILRRQSPLTYVENVRTPLLILHSLRDFRCDLTEAEMLYKSLKALRREVEMVLFPEESHGLSRMGTPSRRVARLHMIRDWFIRHLAPTGAPAPVSEVAAGAAAVTAGARRLGS